MSEKNQTNFITLTEAVDLVFKVGHKFWDISAGDFDQKLEILTARLEYLEMKITQLDRQIGKISQK